jgi:hypothetical protein
MSQSLASSAAKAARTGGLTTVPGRAAAVPARTSARRPPLRVVQAPRTSGSPLGFAMICAALLAAGLISLLLLNTAVAQDSFGLQRLQAGSQQLTDQKQALIQSNDLAAAPAQLSAKAWALGLVPANGVAFVQLPSGKVLGVADPAVRVKPPTVITSTNRTTGTTGTVTVTTTAPVVRTGPVLAPASPVARTAGTGTAPGLAPAAPPVPTGQPGTTPKTTTPTTTTTTTPTR